MLHRAIFRSLRAALGLTAAEANQHLIRAYADIPAAEPPPEKNLCYYFLQTDATAPMLQENTTELSQEHAESSLAHTFSFLPCRLVLVFYGADCESWAHRCRTFLFLDGEDHPRSILRSVGLYTIPSPRPPSIVYEEIGKTWRKRADLVISARLVDDTAYGNVIDGDPIAVDVIESVPSVKIHRGE